MRVLISTSSFATADRKPLEFLEEAGLEVELPGLGRTLKPDEVTKFASGCSGIIAGTESFSADILRRLPELKVISRVGVGMDAIDLPAAKDLGIEVFNTPYGPTEAVAELTLALTLDVLRGVSRNDAAFKAGTWQKRMGRLLNGKSVGVIGAGRIGRRVADLFQAFGCHVIICDICPDESWVEDRGVAVCDIASLLRQADIVTLHAACGPDGGPLIGASELELMKSGAVLINTARGNLVDEPALVSALNDRRLSGAGLDTFAVEPYAGPLLELDNVVLSPHVGSYAVEARNEMELQAVQSLLAGLGFSEKTGNGAGA